MKTIHDMQNICDNADKVIMLAVIMMIIIADNLEQKKICII